MVYVTELKFKHKKEILHITEVYLHDTFLLPFEKVFLLSSANIIFI